MKPRKIKDIIGIVITVFFIGFFLGLIFIPLHWFVGYANFLFDLILIVLPFYLIAEVYYFVKDTPRRRAGTLPKNKKRKITLAIEWALIAVFIIIFLMAKNGSILKQECPSIIQGNPNAELTIKYFFNPFCPSCWTQETILRETLDIHEENIRLERYDYRFCIKEGRELGLRMIPGYMFQIGDEIERFGPLTGDKLPEIICEKIECENNNISRIKT